MFCPLEKLDCIVWLCQQNTDSNMSELTVYLIVFSVNSTMLGSNKSPMKNCISWCRSSTL